MVPQSRANTEVTLVLAATQRGQNWQWLLRCLCIVLVVRLPSADGVQNVRSGAGNGEIKATPSWPFPLQHFPVRQCNWTPPETGQPSRLLRRLPGYAHGRDHFQNYFNEWDIIQGFIAPESVFFMHLITLLQHDVGVFGAVGEIGIASGLSLMGMALARRGNESLVAIDLFDLGGGDARNAGDDLGGHRLDMLAENLLEIGIDWRGSPSRQVVVHQGSSLDLSDVDLIEMSGARGYRMFHVDGAHFAQAAFHDLCSVSCSLRRGGVLMLDDVFSTGWLGVGEGFHRFMHVQGWLRDNVPELYLEPFLYAGRLYMSQPKYASAYRQQLRSILPTVGSDGLMVSKYLYGAEVLFPKAAELKLMKKARRLQPIGGTVDEKRLRRFEWGEAMLSLRPTA